MSSASCDAINPIASSLVPVLAFKSILVVKSVSFLPSPMRDTPSVAFGTLIDDSDSCQFESVCVYGGLPRGSAACFLWEDHRLHIALSSIARDRL